MNRNGVRLLQLVVVAAGAVVVVCSAWPWITDQTNWGLYNPTLEAASQSGLSVGGDLTRLLGYVVVTAGVLAVRSRTARAIGVAVSGAVCLVAAQTALEFQNVTGWAPAGGLLLVIVGAAVAVPAFGALEVTTHRRANTPASS